jgi:hypothetical protein
MKVFIVGCPKSAVWLWVIVADQESIGAIIRFTNRYHSDIREMSIHTLEEHLGYTALIPFRFPIDISGLRDLWPCRSFDDRARSGAFGALRFDLTDRAGKNVVSTAHC